MYHVTADRTQEHLPPVCTLRSNISVLVSLLVCMSSSFGSTSTRVAGAFLSSVSRRAVCLSRAYRSLSLSLFLLRLVYLSLGSCSTNPTEGEPRSGSCAMQPAAWSRPLYRRPTTDTRRFPMIFTHASHWLSFALLYPASVVVKRRCFLSDQINPRPLAGISSSSAPSCPFSTFERVVQPLWRGAASFVANALVQLSVCPTVRPHTQPVTYQRRLSRDWLKLRRPTPRVLAPFVVSI